MKSRSAITALIMLVVSCAAAASPESTFTWDAPTQRVDGSALALDEIGGYRLYCGEAMTEIPPESAGGEYTVERSTILSGYGVHQCHLTTLDTEGRESRPSNTVEIDWPKTPPAAPTNFIRVTPGTR